MKKVKFTLIILMFIIANDCLAQSELKTTLAPHLAISTELLNSFIISKNIQNNGDFSFNVQAGFIMHLRPFELLCDISRVISEKEAISIRLNILDEHKQRVTELIHPLEEISAQFLVNDLHVYHEDIDPVIKSFTKGANGASYIAQKHYFEIIIQPKLFNDKGIPSNSTMLFFERFFKNKLTRENGSIIDVSFDRDDPSNGYHLKPDDLKYLIMQFGDKDFPPALSSNSLSSGNGNRTIEKYLQGTPINKKISINPSSSNIEKSI